MLAPQQTITALLLQFFYSCCANLRRRSEAQHCSSLCSQSEGDEYCVGQTRLKIQQSHALKRWTCSLRVRGPHFASKVSYSASPQTFTECSRSTSCCYAALLFDPKPRRDFLDFENPKVMRRPAVPILFSECGTRHDRMRDETRSNAGRDAIERGRAFAIKYRDRIGSPYF